MVPRNVGILPHHYTVSQLTRPHNRRSSSGVVTSDKEVIISVSPVKICFSLTLVLPAREGTC
jgi:hypothetical protein